MRPYVAFGDPLVPGVRFLTWVHTFLYSLYAVCTCSIMAGDECRLYAVSLVLKLCFVIIIPMLFFQYGVVDVFSDHLGINSSAISSMACVMLGSLVSIYVHSMLVVAVVMCSW